MNTTTDHGVVLVDVLDADGYETGRTVAIECWWVTERDGSYGEDADGNRGVTVETVTVLDLYINPAALAGLNSAQVEQILDNAAKHLERGRAA